MPEGDTLFRTAAALRKALLNRTITDLESVIEQVLVRTAEVSLVGRRMQAVEARGKHLLMVFRDDRIASPPVPTTTALHLPLEEHDLVLHTHLELIGSWHIYRPGETWQKPARLARVVIHTDAFITPCFGAPLVELLSARETARNRTLNSLGPDAIQDEFDPVEAYRRLRRRPDLEIAVALMNQRAMAGVGNVYKSEVLFVRRVSPFRKVGDLSDEELKGLVAESHRLLQLNTTRGSRKTMPGLSERDLLWVYGRTGQPCRVCKEPIQWRRQGLDARSTYYCPRCQQVMEPPT